MLNYLTFPAPGENGVEVAAGSFGPAELPPPPPAAGDVGPAAVELLPPTLLEKLGKPLMPGTPDRTEKLLGLF